MIKEFRDFLMRGNLVELAVAFVMGLAFAALMASFVEATSDEERRHQELRAAVTGLGR